MSCSVHTSSVSGSAAASAAWLCRSSEKRKVFRLAARMKSSCTPGLSQRCKERNSHMALRSACSSAAPSTRSVCTPGDVQRTQRLLDLRQTPYRPATRRRSSNVSACNSVVSTSSHANLSTNYAIVAFGHQHGMTGRLAILRIRLAALDPALCIAYSRQWNPMRLDNC